MDRDDVVDNLVKEITKTGDSMADAIGVLAKGIVSGDDALLSLIQALITKVQLLEERVFECECQLQTGPGSKGRTVN